MHATHSIGRAAAPAVNAPKSSHLFGDDGFNFRDVLDVINPLHHIPIVGHIYRKLTGDVIAPTLRIAGGALFGGPLGVVAAAASVTLESVMNATPATESLPPTALASRGDSRGWMAPPPSANSDGTSERASLVDSRLASRGDSAGWMAAFAPANSGSTSDPASLVKPRVASRGDAAGWMLASMPVSSSGQIDGAGVLDPGVALLGSPVGFRPGTTTRSAAYHPGDASAVAPTLAPARNANGGWMGAMTRHVIEREAVAHWSRGLAATALVDPQPISARRRGGWMVAAAYAEKDAGNRARLTLVVDARA